MNPALAHPRTGKSISVSVAIALRACVRASERSCERETILQWLGLGARICGSSSSVRPSVVVRPGGHLDEKFAQ